MGQIVRLEKIVRSFRHHEVLREISLSLKEGNFYVLLGVNGAGKSTLMKILMRSLLPNSGSGEILGIPLEQDGSANNSRIGFVSEEIQYNYTFSVRKFFDSYKKFYPHWDDEIFSNMIDTLHLDLDRNPTEYSRGQKMQLSFAAAVAIQPAILMLDEVTAVLDAHVRAYFMKFLKEYCKNGGTVIMATNIISEVTLVADHLILLHEGDIKLDCPLPEVETRFLKIRRFPKKTHDIFRDAACHEVSINTDQSVSCLIPRKRIGKRRIPKAFKDKRKITPEEVFIYFTKERLAA